MKLVNKVLIILALIIYGSAANTYELATHGRLTYEAYNNSIMVDLKFLKDIGIDNGKNPFGITYYDISGSQIKERTCKLFEQQEKRMPTGVEPLSIEGWLMYLRVRAQFSLIYYIT